MTTKTQNSKQEDPFVYRGTPLSPEHFEDGVIKPTLTQTAEENTTGAPLQRKIIATYIKRYALCYAFSPAHCIGWSACHMIDKIPFTIVSQKQLDSIAQSGVDKKNRYLYMMDKKLFKPVALFSRECVSTQPVPIVAYEAFSPRELLEKGVQVYVHNSDKLISKRWNDILETTKSQAEFHLKMMTMINVAVKRGELRHLNQEIGANPIPFKTSTINLAARRAAQKRGER